MTAGFIAEDVSWLPLATRRALAAEERREFTEARDADADRDQRAEAKRNAAAELFQQQAYERGEAVSAMAIATGQCGRTLGDILATAEVIASREDTRAEVMQRRERGERGYEICLNEVPVSRSAPKSPEDREVWNTVRRYRAGHGDTGVIDRARIAAEARRMQWQNQPLIPARTASGTGWPG